MRIALTVKGAGLGAWLDDDFANCMQVMIVDDANHFKSWMNPNQGGDDSSALLLAESIIKENVDVLVTNHAPQFVKNFFDSNGVKLVTKNGGTVFTIIEEVREGLGDQLQK